MVAEIPEGHERQLRLLSGREGLFSENDMYERVLDLLKSPEQWDNPDEVDRYAIEFFHNNVCNTVRISWSDHKLRDAIDIDIVVQLDGYLPENIYNGEWKVNAVDPDAYWNDIVWIPFTTVKKGNEEEFTKEKFFELCELLNKETLVIEHESLIFDGEEKKLYDTWKKYCYEKQWDGLPHLPVNACECSLEFKIQKATAGVKNSSDSKLVNEKEIDSVSR